MYDIGLCMCDIGLYRENFYTELSDFRLFLEHDECRVMTVAQVLFMSMVIFMVAISLGVMRFLLPNPLTFKFYIIIGC